MVHSQGFLNLSTTPRAGFARTLPKTSNANRKPARLSTSSTFVRITSGKRATRRRDSPGQGNNRTRYRNDDPDHQSEIILYCGGGYRSALAADALQKMGYTNVISMDGGWKRWVELGYPIES